MDALTREFADGLPDEAAFVRLLVRLVLAAMVGALVGLERERMQKPAGLRTHMLVSTGSALFMLASIESGIGLADLSRVIQGVAAGIGFLGAGAILKLTTDRDILGLTTAASVWVTAALGVTVGLGRLGLAIAAAVLMWVTLSFVRVLERRYGQQ
jgi:putative Mg2+ transporter-C (MgtC) family protein